MTAKQIAFDIEAREQMLKGIQKLAKAVKTTLGPSGRVVRFLALTHNPELGSTQSGLAQRLLPFTLTLHKRATMLQHARLAR